ncbi:hypothetical protein VP01_756g2 [Puccinia sorghi]|uniref:Uncharacterized protein n=1 Tax=Puccinia sorghi TaxID=27349 RepID=A0A0L6UE46_9BASI|nr:hypothetical protein VP01_756g2 [Puccinia sorghi]
MKTHIKCRLPQILPDMKAFTIDPPWTQAPRLSLFPPHPWFIHMKKNRLLKLRRTLPIKGQHCSYVIYCCSPSFVYQCAHQEQTYKILPTKWIHHCPPHLIIFSGSLNKKMSCCGVHAGVPVSRVAVVARERAKALSHTASEETLALDPEHYPRPWPQPSGRQPAIPAGRVHQSSCPRISRRECKYPHETSGPGYTRHRRRTRRVIDPCPLGRHVFSPESLDLQTCHQHQQLQTLAAHSLLQPPQKSGVWSHFKLNVDKNKVKCFAPDWKKSVGISYISYSSLNPSPFLMLFLYFLITMFSLFFIVWAHLVVFEPSSLYLVNIISTNTSNLTIGSPHSFTVPPLNQPSGNLKSHYPHFKSLSTVSDCRNSSPRVPLQSVLQQKPNKLIEQNKTKPHTQTKSMETSREEITGNDRQHKEKKKGGTLETTDSVVKTTTLNEKKERNRGRIENDYPWNLELPVEKKSANCWVVNPFPLSSIFFKTDRHFATFHFCSKRALCFLKPKKKGESSLRIKLMGKKGREKEKGWIIDKKGNKMQGSDRGVM